KQHLLVTAGRVFNFVRFYLLHEVPFSTAISKAAFLPGWLLFRQRNPLLGLRKNIRIPEATQVLILWVLYEYPRIGLSTPPFGARTVAGMCERYYLRTGRTLVRLAIICCSAG